MTMKNTTTTSDRLQLNELDCYTNENNSSRTFKLLSVLQKLWQGWVIEVKSSNDPKVWQTIDRSGTTWWHAYHPATGQSATRESETEILEWIDSGRN
jgi:hypothetical protein